MTQKDRILGALSIIDNAPSDQTVINALIAANPSVAHEYMVALERLQVYASMTIKQAKNVLRLS